MPEHMYDTVRNTNGRQDPKLEVHVDCHQLNTEVDSPVSTPSCSYPLNVDVNSTRAAHCQSCRTQRTSHYPRSSYGSDNGLVSNKFEEIAVLKEQVKTLRLVVLVALLFSLAAVIVTIIFMTKSHGVLVESQKEPVKSEEPYNVCLPCEEVKSGALVEDPLFHRPRPQVGPDGQTIQRQCCVRHDNATQLNALLDAYVQRRLNIQEAKAPPCRRFPVVTREDTNCSTNAGSGNSKVAAHLVFHGSTQIGIQEDESSYAIQSWYVGGDLSFKHKVEYRNGSLVVPEAGRYYIYSQVYFFEHNNISQISELTHNRVQGHTLVHTMRRQNLIYRSGGSERLLQHRQTKCWESSKTYVEHTSFLAGIFMLRKGDEIYVSVSHPLMVHRDTRSTFFGLVKL